MDDQHYKDSVTQPARHETALSRERNFNKWIRLDLQPSDASEDSSISVVNTILNLCSGEFSGMGMVELESMVVTYMIKKQDGYIKCGVYNSAVVMPIDSVAVGGTGFTRYANPHTFGAQVEHELVIPDLWSRQIQPPSAALPSWNLYVDAVSTSVTVDLYIKFHGFIVSFKTLKL